MNEQDFGFDPFTPVDRHMDRAGNVQGGLEDAWRAEHGDEPFPE